MENLSYYIFCIVALIVGVFIIKKVAGCLIRTVIFAVIVAALAVVYYLYFRQ